MLPVPNGQMPAMARNSVDLPEPDGPVTSTRSGVWTENASAATSGVPLGRFTQSCSREILRLPPAALRAIAGSCGGRCAAASTDISKPSRGGTMERQFARDLERRQQEEKD